MNFKSQVHALVSVRLYLVHMLIMSLLLSLTATEILNF